MNVRTAREITRLDAENYDQEQDFGRTGPCDRTGAQAVQLCS